jgi:hypothetical protein
MFQITCPLIGNLGFNMYPEEIERVVMKLSILWMMRLKRVRARICAEN